MGRESKAGIYVIKNSVSNQIYIGSSKDLNKRKRDHFSYLRRGAHHSSSLQSDYNLYGSCNFEFKVIEECPVKKLIKREQYYINKCKPTYNICMIAGSTKGIKRSEETKRKISESKRQTRDNYESRSIKKSDSPNL